MSLSSQEIERYARQIIAWASEDLAEQAQGRARPGHGAEAGVARAAISGRGRVGTLEIVDDNSVSLSNLHRQVIHSTADVGLPKTDTAQAAIARINPHVTVESVALRLDAGTLRLLSDVSTSCSTARTISRPATPCPTLASLSAGRSFRRRSANSTAR